MRVIVEGYNKSMPFEIKEVESKQLDALSKQVKYVEMDFQMILDGNKQLPALALFDAQSMLLATIGSKQLSQRVDALYNMASEELVIQNNERALKETYWVSCYTNEDKIMASQYIRSIYQLIKWAKQIKKPLVIYSAVSPKEKFYRYRSLTGKIINKLMEEVHGVILMHREKADIAAYYIPSHNAFEFYIEKGVYLTCEYEEMINRVVNCMAQDEQCDFRQVYRIKKQEESLYNDLFYKMIPNEERIYVPFEEDEIGDADYMKGLGLEVIQGPGNYSLIYDTKRKINEKSKQIRPYVIPRYESPILERGREESKAIKDKIPSYRVMPRDSDYSGKGVYIAIVSESGVDYRLENLRNPDGTTRIAGIWYQTSGNQGAFFTQDEINKALQSEKPEEIVPIDTSSNENTMLLNIIGGKGARYEGVATQAEFLVAKVNSAPKPLQRIYGGMPNEKNILMADLMVAIWQLQRFAKAQKHPTIFYVPYYTNIDGHDGLSFYNTLLNCVAIKEGHAVIAPTGEEGDKRHHQTLYDETTQEPVVNLQCEKDGQNIVGCLMRRYLTNWQVVLTAPSGKSTMINNAGKYLIDQSIIYSQGETLNYYSGAKELWFRISNMEAGGWILEVKGENNDRNPVDLWISGEGSNSFVRLLTQNPYATIGSVGNIWAVTCIGGYNLEQLTTLKSSGRGYTIGDSIKPTLVSGGSIVTMNEKNEMIQIVGTEVSASMVAGMAATIFEKWEVERGHPLLNGILLNSMLLEYMKRPADIPFPNPNQGYGILEASMFNKILLTPFNA